MSTLLIKNGTVTDPANKISGRVLDVFLRDGKVAQVKKSITVDADVVVDAKGKDVVPGLIDMHVHLREPGREDKETIATATRAAARGGITTIAGMPNTDPVADSAAAVAHVVAQGEKEGVVTVYPYGSITQDCKGETIAEMGQLVKAGAVGFTDDGGAVANANVMRRAMEYAKAFDAVIAPHCEDVALSGEGVMLEGAVSTRMGLPGIPPIAQETMIARDIALAEYTGARLHISHVASARSVELVREAKRRGVKVTCEVMMHHILLTHEDVERYGTNAIMKPQLGTHEDIRALMKGLQDGTIDVIASDHAPHLSADKYVPLAEAAMGIVGLETTVPLALTHLVKKRVISFANFVRTMTVAPATILRLHKGTLAKDADADVTIIDRTLNGRINKDVFLSKGRNTPFHGWDFVGAPVVTIVAGNVVMRDGVVG